MLTILGVIPFMVVGAVLATLGVNAFESWQFWVILVAMLVSEAIGYYKGLRAAVRL